MNDASRETRRRLRVASYNVHGCVGTDGVFSPERIAQVLSVIDADFVALQEVEEREFKGRSVSSYLTETLALREAGRTTHRRGDFDYGNVLLARAAVGSLKVHDLSLAGREPRGAVEGLFDLDGLSLRLFGTHFGLSFRERRAQLGILLQQIDGPTADLTILCADFNEWLPFSHIHRRLGRKLGAARAPRTFPSTRPLLKLDRIYAAPVAAVLDIRSVTTPLARSASDHLPVLADIELSPAVRGAAGRTGRAGDASP
ncbi:MAG: endonuclease/exonuclease/phosphatase family protein [Gammaproteobacteria bacterium]